MIIETRVSDIQIGDEWFLEGKWVKVEAAEVKHPNDRVTVIYMLDGESFWDASYRGFELAIVKRP